MRSSRAWPATCMTGSDAGRVAAQLAARIQEEVRRAGLATASAPQEKVDRIPEKPETPRHSTPTSWTEGESAPIAGASAPPSVFVSWAHRDESWTDDEAQDWERTVAEFATVLRRLGIDSDVDLYHLDEAGIDWTRFGPQAIVSNDFVLVAVSEAWAQRWSGTNHPRSGAGAAAEADMLKGLFQRDQAAFQRRTQIVILPGRSSDDVPPDLNRLVRHVVDPSDADSVLPLIRSLTGQPRYPIPSLGTVPVLPPALRRVVDEVPPSRPEDEFGEVLDAVEALRLRLKSSRGARRSELAQQLAALEGILDAISNA
jgi:hypothetical protein